MEKAELSEGAQVEMDKDSQKETYSMDCRGDPWWRVAIWRWGRVAYWGQGWVRAHRGRRREEVKVERDLT